MKPQSRKTDQPSPLLERPMCDDGSLWDLWLSRLHLPAVVVADELDLFRFLRDQPATATEVADSLALSTRGTESLLSVLAGLGLLQSVEGRFHLTTLSSEYLIADSPYYWGGVLAAFRGEPDRNGPQNMLKSLRDDQESQQRRISHAWEAGSLSSSAAQKITAYMHSHSFPSAVGLAHAVDLNGASQLLDVGAGSGCFSIALAVRHENLSCTLLDLPAVCEIAHEYVNEYGLSKRITTAPANFFTDEWPRGYDAILFSNVLHDWDMGQCEFLLDRAFHALERGGKLLIHEMLQADAGFDLAASAFSLQMAMGTLGSQFSSREISELVVQAGFSAPSFVKTFGHFSTAVAYKP